MPYADPDRQRAWKREAARRYRRERRRRCAAVQPEASPALPELPMADRIIGWIEQTLVVPAGLLKGEPFRLGAWQQEFIREALADGITEAGLTVARKNGKTALTAAVVLAYLAGPAARPDWRGLCTSLTADLALAMRNAVMETAAASGLEVELRRSPRPGQVIGPEGATVQFLSADRASGHAHGADLAIVDEAGLLAENQRGLWAAMLSSTSARGGRLLAISILGDGPLMGELRARRDDPGVVWHGYTTDAADDPLDPDVWAKANPGLAHGIKSRAYMQHAARRAVANPADMSSFRAYDLNAPAAPGRQLLVTMEQYGPARRDPPDRAGPVVVGIDLGGSASMTAAAAFWPECGRLEVKAALPGIPELRDRALADGVGTRYERMRDRGELTIYPGCRTTPVGSFLSDFLSGIAGCRLAAIVSDRYRQSEALDCFASVGVRCRLVWRGQGWMDASHDVRAFQRFVIDRRLTIGKSLLLEHAIQESALAVDPAGNQKLDRARARGRIDAASAAVLAVGEGERLLMRRPKLRSHVVR